MAAVGRLARQRRERAEQGRFVLDGPTLLTEAVAAGVEVLETYVDPATVERPEVAAAVAAARQAGSEVWWVDGGLARISDVVSPHGLCAVARIPASASAAISRSDPEHGPALHLILDRVADPGNAGTLVRTAEAVAATSVVLTDGSVDVWAPKVVRASAGSVLRVPVGSAAPAAVVAEAKAAGVALVGTSAHDGARPEEVDLTGPVALVLGSEAHGLAPELEAELDLRVRIPMAGAVESLNVAVAGSVLAFEVRRQRRAR